MSGILTRELLIVAAMITGTLVTRFLPFLLFPKGKELPEFINYLSSVLPFATMGLLVVYCLKGVSLSAPPYGLPEFLAAAGTAALHWWKRNSFLSIGAGTVFYMFLVQAVFC